MTARAPYNFIPLPQASEIVDVRDQDDASLSEALPAHDQYHPQRRTGYFDVSLTTKTPLYIRGMLSQKDAIAGLSLKDQESFFQLRAGDPLSYTIPGSSLRGMLRSLFEIVTFSKLQPIFDRKLFYRSVEVSSMGETYRGRMVGKVEAGFVMLNSKGEREIAVCQKLRVPRDLIGGIRVYDGSGPNRTARWRSSYHQYQRVWVKPGEKDRIESIADRPAPDHLEGILVITGDVPRKKKEFVFLAPSHDVLPMSPELWDRFHDNDQITNWQEKAFPVDQPSAGGRPKPGAFPSKPASAWGDPVFFLREGGQVSFFGRAMMFRLPYLHSPLNLVEAPLKKALRSPETLIDLAEGVFGFVDRATGDDSRRAYAGRVNITQAVIDPSDDQSPYEEDHTAQLMLQTPKPTSFQHYLEQKAQPLKHYDTPGAQLRGHKLYWRRNLLHTSAAAPLLDDGKAARADMITKVRALRPDIRFQFRVSFENLTDIELGALVWAIQLPPNRYHALGLGKPAGMGVVRLEVTAFQVDDRAARYRSLFDQAQWAQPAITNTLDDMLSVRNRFEAFMKHRLEKTLQGANFSEHPRIRALDRMLRLYEESDQFEQMGLGTFRERPILPSPLEIQGLIPVRAAQVTVQVERPPLTEGLVIKDCLLAKIDGNEAYFDLSAFGSGYVGYLSVQDGYTIGKKLDVMVEEIEPAFQGQIYVRCRRSKAKK